MEVKVSSSQGDVRTAQYQLESYTRYEYRISVEVKVCARHSNVRNAP